MATTIASAEQACSSPKSSPLTQPRAFRAADLAVLDLLEHPVYIFCMQRKNMFWANRSAISMWNAESLQDLQARDFVSDMSQATEQRLKDYIRRFTNDSQLRIREQWTMFPAGKKITVNTTCSGIWIRGENGDETQEPVVAILSECELSSLKKDVDQASLRGVEMLRHLPVAVSQFTITGDLMEQNPEALDLFGGMEEEEKEEEEKKQDEKQQSQESQDEQQQSQDNQERTEPQERQAKGSKKEEEEKSAPSRNEDNDQDEDKIANSLFARRFIDRKLGQKVFQQVASSGNDYCIDAQLHTSRGSCWSAVKVRRSRDPVTEEPVILYSARDISEVVKAKNEANQSAIEKSEMLSVLSHEIRTPLHQVVGFIELLGKTVLDKEQKDFVNSLQTSTISLMTIINDVLDYTKLEAGKMQIESIPFEPSGVCRGCLEVIGPIAEKKGLKMKSCCDGGCDLEGVVVMGDPNRIRQVLLNLLSNAIKFTHEGEVSLRLTIEKKQESKVDDGEHLARFVVSDTGIGMAPEHTSVIFRKYQQANATVARKYGGTGLGLSICKTLAKAMHGTLTVTSSLGKGSEFCFEIPVRMADPSPAPSVEEFHQDDERATTSLNILVAEDNVMNQKLVAAMLKRGGHTATIVENGQLAVDEVRKRKKTHYDLVLMDVQMPVLGGVEATQLIRSKGFSKTDLPIIGLTASFQSADLAYYIGIGMNDCMGKPVRMRALQQVVSEIRHASPRMMPVG